jgi:hypothetical protein
MMRSVRLVQALVVVLVVVADAGAATPRSRAILEDHRHYTRGHDWHVQIEVNKRSDRLATVVAYAQECGETGFTQEVRIGADGSFSLDRELADKQGRFTVAGRFVSPDRAKGSFAVTTGDCEFGRDFVVQDATGHFLLGNPYEYAPARIAGDSLAARRVRRLKYELRRNAPRFTPARARAMGYEFSSAAGCPGLNHARKHGTSMWGRVLDPAAPQSLVYWCDAQRHWTLAGVMFRAAGRTRPPTFDRMIQWHKHGATRTATWMTHVWLVRDPIAAFATCAPFPAFTAAGMFAYHRYIAVPGDQPCSDTAR